jgi:hypothetical protein
MATVTISMKPDGTYALLPPFVVLTRSDQGITWNLAGANWVWMTTPPGIVCESAPPDPPYSAWPSNATGPALNTTTNQFEGNANSPNTGTDTVYYKWTFTVRNTNTGQVVQVDPDIGNEPRP